MEKQETNGSLKDQLISDDHITTSQRKAKENENDVSKDKMSRDEDPYFYNKKKSIQEMQHVDISLQEVKVDSPLEKKEITLTDNRCSYQDLEELHEVILESKEESEESGNRFCSCFRKPKPQKNEWLKHFKILVKNNRFIENSWSGGLFTLVNERFKAYNNVECELAELNLKTKNSLEQAKSKILTTSKEQISPLHNPQLPLQLKEEIENLTILEEEVENSRQSQRIEKSKDEIDISRFFTPETEKKDLEDQFSNRQMKIPQQMEDNNKISKKEKLAHADNPEVKIQQLDRESKIIKNREVIEKSADLVLQPHLNSSKLKKQDRSFIRSSTFLGNKGEEDENYDHRRSMSGSEIGLGFRANTLLINSEQLEADDGKLYEALVFYKSIMLVIEQHLKEENNYTQEKPLRVIRDNFIDFYIRTYGGNLQSLTNEQIIASIQDLKEFITLFLEIIREYYKLDELVEQCPLSDRFLNIDNLVNFLCSLLFQDDAVYSIVYVSHCHFDQALSLGFFQTVEQLLPHITLEMLKVSDKYCLNEKTLIKFGKMQSLTDYDDSITELISTYQGFNAPFQKAYLYLQRLSHQRSPVHKLKVMIKTQDLINECIKDFYNHFQIDYSDIFYDADNLISIFSYILIKSQVYDIKAHCKIIENFATRNTLNSRSGYLLVTIQCCISYLTTLNVSQLISLPNSVLKNESK